MGERAVEQGSGEGAATFSIGRDACCAGRQTKLLGGLEQGRSAFAFDPGSDDIAYEVRLELGSLEDLARTCSLHTLAAEPAKALAISDVLLSSTFSLATNGPLRILADQTNREMSLESGVKR